MKHWSDSRVAGTAGAELARPQPDGRAADGPTRVVIDSREAGAGDLFVGIPGEQVDGGSFARRALEAGAWGVIVTPRWAGDALGADGGDATQDAASSAFFRIATCTACRQTAHSAGGRRLWRARQGGSHALAPVRAPRRCHDAYRAQGPPL